MKGSLRESDSLKEPFTDNLRGRAGGRTRGCRETARSAARAGLRQEDRGGTPEGEDGRAAPGRRY
ncbi:hypothetical protein GCM10027360_03970 [Amycolatopsis echigonensis]